MPTLATAATGTIVKLGSPLATIPELRNATDIGMAFAMVECQLTMGTGGHPTYRH